MRPSTDLDDTESPRRQTPMLKAIAAVVALAAAAAPAAAQAVWDARDLGGGSAEFRLGNDEGAVIILVCQLGGISAGFEFPGSLDATESASIRGVPGERQNVAVAPVNDRVLRLTSGRGLEAAGLTGGGFWTRPPVETPAGARAGRQVTVEVLDGELDGETAAAVEITDAAALEVVRVHTCEAGVRELSRQLGAICQGVASRRVETGDTAPVTVVAVVAVAGAAAALYQPLSGRQAGGWTSARPRSSREGEVEPDPLSSAMSEIAQAIANRQSEINRLQAEIKALTDVEQILGASPPTARSTSRRSSSPTKAAAAADSKSEAKPARKRREMSAAEKKAVSERMTAYWAERRKKAAQK